MNRSFGRLALGFLLIGIAVALFAFLAFWYWEMILWIIFLPLPVASLNLGIKILRASAGRIALVLWFLSVVWVLGFVLALFQDVTAGGIFSVGLVASLFGLACSQYIRRSPASSLAHDHDATARD